MNLIKFITDVPSNQWITFLLFFGGIVFFIGLAEFLRKTIGWSQEFNRKLVHILTGVLVFLSPLFFKYPAPLVILGIIFTIVNSVALATDSLKGMDNSERKTYGTVYFPIAFILLIFTCWTSYKSVLMASILILGIADAMAAIVGESVKNPRIFNLTGEKKSVQGSSAMFVSTFLIVFFTLPLIDYLDNITISFALSFWIAIVTALFATGLETLSFAGSDNLTVPLGSAFAMSFMLHSSTNGRIMLTAGALIAIAVAYSSYKANSLSKSGSMATFILAFIIFGAGGLKWSIPILTFFALSSALSKIAKRKKEKYSLMFEKSDTRDIYQVLANGGIAGTIMFLNIYFPSNIWYYIYIGTLAAVNSDTWATEIGVLSIYSPVSFRSFKKTEKGRSGAISILGTLSAFIGSAVIILSGFLAAPELFRGDTRIELLMLITVAGFSGSFIDTVLGAFFQAQYKCPECGKITERKTHCSGIATQKVSGISWVNNDIVNFTCSVTGALVTYVFIKLLI
ncbi:DUF92 domain-containing protein [bacterium]|nr:DUF92 domain-containing protein [bacterium]